MGRFRLIYDNAGYCLDDVFSAQNPLRVGFESQEFLTRIRHAGKKSELVARAVKAKAGLRVLDCTAGPAKDAFILAHLGCELVLLERSIVIATLLEDGLRRASQIPELARTVARMRIVTGDARQFLRDQNLDFDVIYIDPMFPEKQTSAAVHGDMQQLQRFLGTDGDAFDLLARALETSCPRIVLKRPPQSEWRGTVAPTHVVSNRNSRYEVFVRGS